MSLKEKARKQSYNVRMRDLASDIRTWYSVQIVTQLNATQRATIAYHMYNEPTVKAIGARLRVLMQESLDILES